MKTTTMVKGVLVFLFFGHSLSQAQVTDYDRSQITSDAPSIDTDSMFVNSLFSTWSKEFNSKENMKDFKKLRTFRSQIQVDLDKLHSIDRRLNNRISVLNEDKYLKSRCRVDSLFIIESVELLNRKNVQNSELVDIIKSSQYYIFYEEKSLEEKKKPELVRILSQEIKKTKSSLSNILAQLKESSEKLRPTLDLIKKVNVKIYLLESDLQLCESAIDSALEPDLAKQNFTTWITLAFSFLVLCLIFMFFSVINNNLEIAPLLLTQTGLQFITIFIIIIAIILFGVLGVLEGKELSAIISGIAGYILGSASKSGGGGVLPLNVNSVTGASESKTPEALPKKIEGSQISTTTQTIVTPPSKDIEKKDADAPIPETKEDKGISSLPDDQATPDKSV